MAAKLPNYDVGYTILVKNIPPKATTEKLWIHFQRKTNGGKGDVLSVTYPISKSKPHQAIVEFEERETVLKVLKHSHQMFEKDMAVCQFREPALGLTESVISRSVIEYFLQCGTLQEKLVMVQSHTGVSVLQKDGKYTLTGQFYQLSAASDMIEDMWSNDSTDDNDRKKITSVEQKDVKEETNTPNMQAIPKSTRNGKTSDDEQKVQESNNFSDKIDDSVDTTISVDKNIYNFMKKTQSNKLRTFAKKFKVAIEEDEMERKSVKLLSASNAVVSPAVVNAFQEMYTKFSTSLHAACFDTRNLLQPSDKDVQQAIDTLSQTHKKVYACKVEQKKDLLLFFASSRIEADDAVNDFRDIIADILKNKSLFEHKFEKTNLSVSVIHGNFVREDVDVLIAVTDPLSPNEIVSNGGEEMKREVKRYDVPWLNGPKMIYTSAGGNLQCKSVIHYLHNTASGKFDLCEVLMEIFDRISMEIKGRSVAIPITCIGSTNRVDVVLGKLLSAVLRFNTQMMSSTENLKTIHILHPDLKEATNLAIYFSKWLSGLGSESASSDSGSQSEEIDVCAICLEDLSHDGPKVKQLPCKHIFHQPCIDRAFNVAKKCPTCMRYFGKPEGTQPPGTMKDSLNPYSSLPGYPKCGTIVIDYSFPSGTQGPEHPHPGQRFHGTSRRAYLPSNPEGREVLLLLKNAFKHRLIFTVGRSVTTGLDNCVTWSEIHHKTSTNGGSSNFGYPDPNYLKRVKEELAAKGITSPY